MLFTHKVFAIAGLTLVGGFYIGAARIADGSAKTYLKTLVLKAVLETNITNFTKDTIKVLEPQEIFLGAQYKALGQEMAENGVIFLSGQKEGKFAENYAAMYKGEVIEEFTKAEMSNFYKKWSKLQGEKLIEELEHLGGNSYGASIVATTDTAKIKTFEEGWKQFSNKIIAKPFEKMKEAIPYFNHKSVGDAVKQIGYKNCGNTVEVLIEYLKTGKLRLDEPSDFQSFEEVIAKCGGGRFSDIGIPRLQAVLGDGEIAIIYGPKKYLPSGKVEGHYFVAVKMENKVNLFDGQTGEYVIFDTASKKYENFIKRGYIKFMYTKVGKIKKKNIMLTDKEMLKIAERYLKKLQGKSTIEPMIYEDETIKKPYGNIYFYDSKEYILTGNFNKSLVGNAPFLVEKTTGRVVGFGTAGRLEDYMKAYENGTMSTALDTYWYPDEDRFDYK